MRHRDIPGDRQPEPGSSARPRLRPYIGFEHALEHLVAVDARTLVADGDPYLAALVVPLLLFIIPTFFFVVLRSVGVCGLEERGAARQHVGEEIRDSHCDSHFAMAGPRSG